MDFVEARHLETWVFWWGAIAEWNPIIARSSSHSPSKEIVMALAKAVAGRIWRCISEFPERMDCQSSPLLSSFNCLLKWGEEDLSLSTFISAVLLSSYWTSYVPAQRSWETGMQSLMVTWVFGHLKPQNEVESGRRFERCNFRLLHPL